MLFRSDSSKSLGRLDTKSEIGTDFSIGAFSAFSEVESCSTVSFFAESFHSASVALPHSTLASVLDSGLASLLASVIPSFSASM